MQATETFDMAQEQNGRQDVTAEAAVGKSQVVGLKMVQLRVPSDAIPLQRRADCCQIGLIYGQPLFALCKRGAVHGKMESMECFHHESN